MSATRTTSVASTPVDLYRVIVDAVNDADVEAFVAAHDDAATIVVPPAGSVARGHAEIRAAITALVALRPELSIVPSDALECDGLALAHGRWHLSVVDAGNRVELTGLGTMVSRRGADGAWRIVLDDPLTGP